MRFLVIYFAPFLRVMAIVIVATIAMVASVGRAKDDVAGVGSSRLIAHVSAAMQSGDI